MARCGYRTGARAVVVQLLVGHPVDGQSAHGADVAECGDPRADGLGGGVRHGARVVARALGEQLGPTEARTAGEHLRPSTHHRVLGDRRLQPARRPPHRSYSAEGQGSAYSITERRGFRS